MKKVLNLTSLLLLMMLFITGCGKGISIQNITTPVEKTNSSSVYQAIKAAGASLGWKITKVAEGNVIGELAIKKHIAIVEIPYSASEYSILYKDSRNLKFDESSQTIHGNYNVWVKRLDGMIQSNLALLGSMAVSKTAPVETTKATTEAVETIESETVSVETTNTADSSMNNDWR